MLKVLIVEGEASEAAHIGQTLHGTAAPDVVHVRTLAEALALPGRPFDVVLADLSLPDAQGTQVIARLHRAMPSAAIVALTEIDDERVALEAMAAGAEDYLVKSAIDEALLRRAVRYAIERKRAEENVRILWREQHARAEAEAAERRARLLEETSRHLADLLDYEATLAATARVAVPALGDLAVVDVVEEGVVRRAAATHARSDREAAAAGLLDFPPDLTNPDDAIARVLRTGEPMLVPAVDDAALARFSGSPEHLAMLRRLSPSTMLVVPLAARGRILGAMTVASDDPARRFTTDDLSFMCELGSRIALFVDNAKVYRAREDMLAVVSHDLRNPLNVIGFAVASLRRAGMSEDQKSGYLEKIRRAADRMNRLIEDLLDVSRLEGRKLPMERAPQPPLPILHDLVEHMRPLAEERSIRIVSEITTDLPDVHVDRERMLQVFSNLVGNSIKFTPQGGTITVGAAPDGEFVRFWVSDTGPGIKPEHLARIFDRFWQARRKDRQGAGLGLAIARGIVLAHDGRIWAESPPERGATFHVAVPASPRTSAATVVEGGQSDQVA